MSTFSSRAYFICCDARTGSSLLAGVLRMTELAGKPFEYFGPVEIDKPWMRRDEMHVPEEEKFTDFRSWRDYILRAGSEFNGVFGASLHWFQLKYALATFSAETGPPARPVEVFRAFFPEVRFIWLHRRNLVAQAISHYVAISSGVWGLPASRPRPDQSIEARAPYAFSEIDRLVAHAQVAESGWRDTLADAPELTLELTYEELNADIDAAVRKVFAHLGLSLGTAPVPQPVLQRQSTEWSRELQRRYREERRARGGGPVGDEHRI
jgi:LPS sulfotransferase NodH